MHSESDTCTEEGIIRIVSSLLPDAQCPRCVNGPLEICENRMWRVVCDRDFTAADAVVATMAVLAIVVSAAKIVWREGRNTESIIDTTKKQKS